MGCSVGPAAHGLWRGLCRNSRRLLFVRLACQFGHLGVEFPCFMRHLPLLALARFQAVQGLEHFTQRRGLHHAWASDNQPPQIGHRAQSSCCFGATTARAPIRPDSAVMTPPQPENPVGTACARQCPRSSRAARRQQLGIKRGNGWQGVGQGHGIRPCAAIFRLQWRECRGLRHGCSRINARPHRVNPPAGAGR